jgi:hypothetical protein
MTGLTVAVVCLHRQPFGFTPQDVEMLQLASRELRHFGLASLASRIAALLPPTPDGS